MIIQEINLGNFRAAFTLAGRKDQFSYEGLEALYDYLENLSEDSGTPYTLDVIELCCAFCEYSGIEELKREYSTIESIEELQENTTFIEIDEEKFIIANF